MSKPLVSIVIPIFNVEKYLEQCLESVIKQSLHEIEIICVNDGSTDGSPTILEKFAQKDERIIVIHKENRGYGHSMNVGMDKARGEYIGIVESDDYICKEMYEILYDKAKKNDLDVVRSNYNNIYADESGREFAANVDIRSKDEYDKLYCMKQLPPIHEVTLRSWNGLFRRQFLVDNNIWHNETPGASYQDVGFCALTTYKSERLMYIKDYLYKYRVDNPNASIKSNAKVYCVFDEYEFIRNDLKKAELYEYYKAALTFQCLRSYCANFIRIADQFIPELIEAMKVFIQKAIENGEYDPRLNDKEKNELYNLILKDTEEAIKRVLEKKHIEKEKIKNFESLIEEYPEIVIYGAGRIGLATRFKILERNLLHKVSCFAITEISDIEFLYNIPVKLLKDIKDKNCLLILAVSCEKSREYYLEMSEYAKTLGFKHIVNYMFEGIE